MSEVQTRPASDRTAQVDTARRFGFFDTPVVVTRLKEGEALVAELEAVVRARRASSEGVRASNVGGWHSDRSMSDWGGEPARRLADVAVQVAKRMTSFGDNPPEDYGWSVQMWANVSGAGAYNQPHIHPGCAFSSVLYIDAGDEGLPPGAAGEFYIEDPRFPVPALHRTGLRLMGADGRPQQDHPTIKVTRGDLIHFPAWLRHGVRPYGGKRERISIAMNIEVINKRALAGWLERTP